MSDFRLAKTFDGVDPKSGPYFSGRSIVVDPEEKRRLIAYLDGAPLIRHAPGFTIDEVDQSKGEVVPIGTATDGVWIWDIEISYYLKTYGYAPDPEFYEHIKAQNYQVSTPSEATLLEALRFLMDYEASHQD
jgi:hypothetical protein